MPSGRHRGWQHRTAHVFTSLISVISSLHQGHRADLKCSKHTNFQGHPQTILSETVVMVTCAMGFDPSPVPGSRGAGLPEVTVADLQLNPGLSQRARLQNTLWSLRVVRRATKGSARHINSLTVKRSCSTGLSQGCELSRDLWCNRFAPYHKLWSHSLCRISESRCPSLGCAQCEKPIICLVDFPVSCSRQQN